MRQGHALLPGLLIALLAGCTTATTPTASWTARLRPFQGPTGPDVVHLYVTLLECPVGDAYFNEELWTAADEQVVALERRAALEENGLRVGQIGGIIPSRLQTLLTSKQHCPNPRQHQFRAGNVKALELGRSLAACRFQLHLDSQSLPVDVTEATCSLHVLPTLTKDGRTRLLFTPVLQHGQAQLKAQPAADRSRWEFLEQRATETYTSLAFEVVLAPNEYVVVGARADRPGTLGQRFFVYEEEAVPVRRLLVIRTNRAPVPERAADDEEKATPAVPSLAAQAVWSAVP